MQPLGSDAIPVEIWLQIASHLNPAHIRHLALLCRPFAALASTSNEAAKLTLNLSIVHAVDVQSREWKCIVSEIAGKMHRRVTSGRAVSTATLFFHSILLPQDKAPTSRSAGFTKSMLNFARKVSGQEPPPLDSMYSKFSAVTALVLIQETNMTQHWEGPSYLSYIRIESLWSHYAPHLRELTISLDRDSLFELNPRQPTVTLPNLEIMRLSYLRRWLPRDRETGDFLIAEDGALTRLAELYTNQKLKALELNVRNGIRYDFQPFPGPLLPDPNRHVFPQLARLSLVSETWEEWASRGRSAGAIHAFIQRHLGTLKSIALRGYLRIWDKFVAEPLPFGDGVSLSLSSAVRDPSSMANDGDIKREEHARLRASITELQLVIRSEPWDCTVLSLLPNLHGLRFAMIFKTKDTSFVLGDKTIVDILAHTPGLVSLNLRRGQAEHDLDQGTLLEEQIIALAASSLPVVPKIKDLAIYQVDEYGLVIPDWPFMRRAADLLPNVESFFGKGHMYVEDWPVWERAWRWSSNPYIDHTAVFHRTY
ncbi:hypothetical protein BKA62DRAFT_684749 [Auriculariales sp. MPI-PUGE-AT-0066]|nr:hypothetical protein BKA62DRAFT_684749 [Auriculariales sp. MPI-PUGE-AT-0066]